MSKFKEIMKEALKEVKKEKPYSLDTYYKDKADQERYDHEDKEDDIKAEKEWEWDKLVGNEESWILEAEYDNLIENLKAKDSNGIYLIQRIDGTYYPEDVYNELAESDYSIEIVERNNVQINDDGSGYVNTYRDVYKIYVDKALGKIGWPIKIAKLPLDYVWKPVYKQSFVNDKSYAANKTALPAMLKLFREVNRIHYPTMLKTVNAGFDIDDNYSVLH